MNTDINREVVAEILRRRAQWAYTYTAEYNRRFFKLYDGELEALLELAAASFQKTKPKKAKLKKTLFRECGDCDGCGWVEGGRGVIQTTCVSCKGKGKVKK